MQTELTDRALGCPAAGGRALDALCVHSCMFTCPAVPAVCVWLNDCQSIVDSALALFLVSAISLFNYWTLHYVKGKVPYWSHIQWTVNLHVTRPWRTAGGHSIEPGSPAGFSVLWSPHSAVTQPSQESVCVCVCVLVGGSVSVIAYHLLVKSHEVIRIHYRPH